MNLFQYVNTKTTTINPSHDVDALVLTMIVYYPFETIAELHKVLPLKIKDLKTIITDKPIGNNSIKQHVRFMDFLIDSAVFGEVEILDFVSEMDVEKVLQYASITLRINNQSIFVSFRGTTSTVIGWKEDFTLSYSDMIPSHPRASQYLKKVASITVEELYCGGHSKGGNVAVYAASTLEDNIRLKKVYNFDGPGFQHDMIVGVRYTKIINKTKKIVPESSIVGMLLESSEPLTIVRSTQLGMFQHNPYTWKIEHDHFEVVESISENAQFISDSLHEVLGSVPLEHRETALKQVFEVMKLQDLDEMDDLRQLLSFENIKKLAQVFQASDEQSVRLLGDILKETLSSTAKMKVKVRVNQFSSFVKLNKDSNKE